MNPENKELIKLKTAIVVNPKIPSEIVESPLSRLIIQAGLSRIHQGKVRDTHQITQGILFQRNTDRISIFDFPLNCLMPRKAEIITAFPIFWIIGPLKDLKLKNHLIAYGSEIDRYLPQSLCNNPELQATAQVVLELAMAEFEGISRWHLSGSAYDEYINKNRVVYGQVLKEGLYEGVKLDSPIFTPHTKESVGHDEHITPEIVRKKYPWLEKRTHRINNRIYEHCVSHEIITADCKAEFSKKGVLGDEWGTPDVCRFWLLKEWLKAAKERKAPQGYDKQVMREWGKTVKTPFLDREGNQIVGINKLDPSNPEHLAFVHQLKVPDWVISETSQRYIRIFKKITDYKLGEFQKEVMKIAV